VPTPRLEVNLPHRLDELRVPPGNRLEALTGDRKGQLGKMIGRLPVLKAG